MHKHFLWAWVQWPSCQNLTGHSSREHDSCNAFSMPRHGYPAKHVWGSRAFVPKTTLMNLQRQGKVCGGKKLNKTYYISSMRTAISQTFLCPYCKTEAGFHCNRGTVSRTHWRRQSAGTYSGLLNHKVASLKEGAAKSPYRAVSALMSF